MNFVKMLYSHSNVRTSLVLHEAEKKVDVNRKSMYSQSFK